MVCLLLAACTGWSTAPTAVTTTGATLHAQASCKAETTTNPCTSWFQYWADGAPGLLSTPHQTLNTNTNGAFYDVSAAVTGLTPNTVYRSQFCGYGDTDVAQPGACIGLPSNPITQPGYKPDAGDLSATQNFRTAGTGTTATVDLGRPLSTGDTAANRISRDAGMSAAWSSTRALWLFGDTSQKNGPPFLEGTTAASGPYVRGQVPTALQEVSADPAHPALLLPTPTGLQYSSTAACGANGSYPAAWPSGVAAIPGTATVLITYEQVCAISMTRQPVERLTLVRYDPATNQILSSATPFAAAPLYAGLPRSEALGSPLFGSDGNVYLYGNDFTNNRILVARVKNTPSLWGNAANYQWWNGTWQSDPAAATSVATVPFAGSVHVADYTGLGSHHLGMIVQTDVNAAKFELLEATSPTGPWTAGPSGQAPDVCGTGTYGCYALLGHAELSTASQFWFSWYSAGDLDRFAHVRLAEVAW